MRPAWSVSPLQPAGRSRRARTERNPKGARLTKPKTRRPPRKRSPGALETDK